MNPSWLSSRSWLSYSKSKDGLYCIPCICISATHHSPFVTTGFRNWKKALGIKKSYIDQHKLSEGHKVAEQKASLFLQQVHQPTSNIGAMLSKQLAEQQIHTKKGILSIIDVILTLEQRGVPFRGNWDKKENAKDGNFAYFVNWKAKFDKDLQDHLEKSADNAKYTSPKIQNTVIEICEEIICERIISRISKYWSLMADETQDCSTSKQVSICVRYVDVNGDVCENFMGFVKAEKMDSKSIADVLLSTLEAWGMDFSGLVGQGYDGAAVISSSKNGVQGRIHEKYPNATYMYVHVALMF